MNHVTFEYCISEIREISKKWYGVEKSSLAVALKIKEEEELRAIVACINLWSPKWVYAEPVHLLCHNETIVRCEKDLKDF